MVTSLTEAFRVAAAELGHKFTDVNAHYQQGIVTIDFTRKVSRFYN